MKPLKESTPAHQIESMTGKALKIWLFAPESTAQEIEEIYYRITFYVPQKHIVIPVTEITLQEMLEDTNPVLQFCQSEILPQELRELGPRIFNIDYRTNSEDGMDWALFTKYISGQTDFRFASFRLNKYVQDLQKFQYDKAYIFGTGPTLEKAISRDWSDGYRVVCNTIVRDAQLWHHLKPHFIVAGDSRYHFGFTSFARAFQRDLHQRLRESETYFLYPEIFDSIARMILHDIQDRLIPIPWGRQKKINIDMTSTYELPALGNVLPMLLLPLACTLSKDIYLWGFDGRAPDDKLFWSNSNQHSYPELMPDLMRAHPAFFEHYMPKDGSNSYVEKYLGDELDRILREAESNGFSFNMMHSTWISSLQGRIKHLDAVKNGTIKRN